MSSNLGLKVSLPGASTDSVDPTQLAFDSGYPVPKCDLRVTPKNYGLVTFTIASLANSAGVTILQQPHGYTYIPSFFNQWSYPAGIAGGIQTYGFGDLNDSANSGIYVAVWTDATNFNIKATNYGLSTLTNIVGSIRFYIFADDFSGS